MADINVDHLSPPNERTPDTSSGTPIRTESESPPKTKHYRTPAELKIWEDWQRLLQTHLYRYVAYGKDGLIAESDDPEELFSLLREKKVSLHGCVVRHVDPELRFDEDGIQILSL